MSLRERKKLETQQALVEAGRTLFRQKGFDGTSLDEIAAEANVSRATLFNYFPNKDALLAEIAAEELRILEAELESKARAMPKALDRMRRILYLLVSESPVLQVTRRVVLETMLRPDEIPEPVARMESLLIELVGQAQQEGDLRADLPPQDIARWAVGAYLAALTFHRWLRADQPGTDVDPSDIEKSVDMLFEGVAGRNYRTG